MNTKKDFIRAAKIVRGYNVIATRSDDTADACAANAVQQAFIEFFREDNPRFDVGQFVEACND